MLALDAPVGHCADRRSRRVRDADSMAKRREPLLKIGDQIAGGFEADVEADDPTAVGAVATPEVEEGHGQARHPAPAIADLEEAEAVNEADERIRWRLWREDDRED